MATKPVVQLSGEDGNIFFIVGRVRRALKKAGLDTAEEMSTKVMAAGSYDEALQVVMQYVEVE